MSKLFIPTVNCGKAHETDIYGLVMTDSYTVTCSGDGYLKLWNNKLSDSELPKEHVISEFVSPVGLHHVSAFHSVEADGQLVIIISAVSFDGAIYFYQVDSEKKALKKLQLLEKNESKYSYWACRWFVSDDSAIENRFVATTVQGVTKVWRFNAFKEREVDENGRPVGPLVYEPHMRLQGNIESQVPRFATSVDISANGLIATGFSDGSVVVSQLSTLRPVYNLSLIHI